VSALLEQDMRAVAMAPAGAAAKADVSAKRVIALVSDAFGGFGGISKFNRDFLTALAACDDVGPLDVLPRIISGPVEGVPAGVVFDRRSADGKSAFARRALATAFRVRSAEWTICGHINLLPLAVPVAAIARSRLALVIHGIDAWKPKHALSKVLARRVDSVISVSECTAERFAAWSGVAAEEFFILPNSIDLDAFVPAPPDPHLRARYGLGEGPVILTLGRIAAGEEKGFQQVIEALPRLAVAFPGVRYLIAGDGTDRPRLEALAQALGVAERVVFAGRIPDAEKAAHYALADVYAMPSRGEGFGIVLIEAAACGVPIVGSRVDGSSEALLDGALGALVDPGKPDEIFEAIAAALRARRPHARNPAVAAFSAERFDARVAEWVATWR
jgi:glycosyltransferase involved in cell wall biosynthesis